MEYCQAHAECMERIRGCEESTKSAHHRINELQENQKILMEMNKNIGILAEQYKNQSEQIEKIEDAVNDLKAVPLKRWNTVITTAVTAFVTGMVAAFLALILK